MANDPNSPNNQARKALEENQRRMAEAADQTAQSAEITADAFDRVFNSVQQVAPALDQLAQDALDAIPKQIAKAADSTSEFKDEWQDATKGVGDFNRKVMDTAPALKELTEDPGLPALPDTFGEAAKAVADFGDELDLDTQFTRWEKFTLSVKSLVASFQGKKMPWIDRVKESIIANQKAEKLPFFVAMHKFRDEVRELNKGDWLDKLKMLQDPKKDFGASHAAVASGAAAAGFGMSVAEQAIIGLKKVAFATWDYIDSYVLPTQVTLNKLLGGTSTALAGVSKQAMNMGGMFRHLGLSFEQGVKNVADISAGLNSVNLPDNTIKEVTKLSEYTGVGAQQASALANQYIQAEGSLKNFTGAMRDAVKVSNQYMVPVQGIRKEFAELPDLASRFGMANYNAFNTAIAKAHRYGLTMKEVDGAFGKTMNTFQGTSEIAAKLNATFGTSLNSVELMQATNVQRMEMISKSFQDRSITFDKLSQSEQDLIADTLHLSNAQANLVLSGEKGRKEFEKQQEQQAKAAKASQDWDSAIGRLKSTLIDEKKLFQDFALAISDVVGKFFGFKTGIKGGFEIAGKFHDIMDQVTQKVQAFAKSMPEGGGKDIFAKFEKMANSLVRAADALGFIASKLGWVEESGKSFSDSFAAAAKSTEMSKENMAEMAKDAAVFAASSPEQKEKLYSQLKAQGINKDAADLAMGHYEQMIVGNKLKSAGLMQGALGQAVTPQDISISLTFDGKRLSIQEAIAKHAAGASEPSVKKSSVSTRAKNKAAPQQRAPRLQPRQ